MIFPVASVEKERVVKFLQWCQAGALGVTLLLFMVACKKEDPAPAPLPPGPGPGPKQGGPPKFGESPMLEEDEPHAAGKKIYNMNGCARCHSMSNAGPKKKGPSLAKVANDPKHTVEWFVSFVGDPKTERPEAKMPPFEKKIQPDDMRALAEFLASLK
jgi:mono/diheme cytochrome c family protein